jgi:hypothetical protein
MIEVNIIAVILAAFSAFFLGFIWYTVVFAAPWKKEIGMGENSDAQAPNLGKLLAGSFALELVMAFVMARFFIGNADALGGLKAGFLMGLTIVGFAFGVNYLFEGKSITHWAINAAYYTVVFSVMGLILGAF